MTTCKVCGYTGSNFEANRYTCRSCRNEHKIEATRTKVGHIKKIYFNQKRASEKRGHSHPVYSLDEITQWLLSQDLFHTLHKQWKESGYDKNLAPSIDRIDNSIGYCFENIQLMTWLENSQLAHEHCKQGKLSTGNKNILVSQYTLDGVLVNIFPTLRTAARSFGKQCRKEIKLCCDGLKNQEQGFIWKYLNSNQGVTI